MFSLRKAGVSLVAISSAFAATSAYADEGHDGASSGINALDHAPIGVMGDHRHAKGEWMISYRLMHMDMEGIQIGTDDVTPEQVATTVPNRFFGAPGQPPTLRIVPTSMRMDMHMAGVMYGLSDQVTLMVMGNYITKEMDHITFQGGMGDTRLGTFRTRTSDFGDTKVAALIGITENVHLNAGVSIPTGTVTEGAEILTPMGMRPTVRTPYPMQIGSGTWDLEPGITYRDQNEDYGWGAQVRGTIRLGDNDEGYAFGDTYQATAWLAASLTPSVALSGRIHAQTLGRVDGIDPNIVGPVQTANPDFQGGDSVTYFTGLNFAATGGALKGWRLGVEAGVPIVQDLNGPQMPTDFTLTVGVQKAF
ncbi:alpha-amylase [Erythrobacter sp. YT30]|uniref:alpha-amylase n=1 Tax=Erythrobacter sp. YT30 TaxID=1735012 RepID=UPI00076BE408|nr:alpha-amylase [Erythrobacter sp. YT30]KWV90603.1 alpha-amylase [Erythrobacter sp. YT30]